jgi:hypothetical protein
MEAKRPAEREERIAMHTTTPAERDLVRRFVDDPKTPGDAVAFLIDDYKLKVGYLEKQFDRMWTRFSFFTTVEVALVGALAYFLFDPANRNVAAAPYPIVLGIVISALWYIVGAEDRYLVSAYRADLKAMARVLADKLGLQWYAPHFVGARTGGPEPYRSPIDRSALSWYPKGVTYLPAFLGIVMTLVWVVILGAWFAGVGAFGG